MIRVVCGLACGLWVGTVAAQSSDQVDLTVGGYARVLGAVQDLGYDLPGIDRRSTFLGQVARLKWQLALGESVRVSVHNRVLGRWSSVTSSGAVLGFGVGATPERTVSLATTLVDEPHLQATHDIERLALTWYQDALDLTVGRQAIAWGISGLFPVADLWAQFSPFELDTEERPGVDAVRALLYPGRGMELDLVVADRGVWREVSAGGRLTVELSAADVYVAAGKFWREATVLGGIAAVRGTWKVRAEGALAWDMDTESLGDPRVTLGVDRVGARVQLSFEYHHNGLGSSEPADYFRLLIQPQVARGETYYLGRHLVGGIASWLATDRVAVSLSALGNLTDPSAALLPAMNYDIGQDFRLTAGGLIALGTRPIQRGPLPLELLSEFGTYGHFGYTQFAVYF